MGDIVVRLIAGLAVALCAWSAAASEYTVHNWPSRPRGGEGTFQQLWSNRAARDPVDGVASFYTDRHGADGERLQPWNKRPAEYTCARPDPAELGACLRITGPGGSILCRVNDIGPAKHLHRQLDLLPAGFRAIGLKPVDGVGRVRIERSSDCKPKGNV